MEPQTDILTEKLPEKEKPFRFYYFQHFHNEKANRFFTVVGIMYPKTGDVPEEIHLLESGLKPPVIRILTGEETLNFVDKKIFKEYTPAKQQSEKWWLTQKRVNY
jgi:hypothetical protein